MSETKLEIFTAFLQDTTPNILTVLEHGLEGNEVTQSMLNYYTVASHFCRKEQKGGGLCIYSLRT
jgi:hypothetical protein